MTAYTTSAESTVSIKKIGNGAGMLLTPNHEAVSFAALHDAGLLQLLADAGHIVARGFSSGIEDFNALVAAHSQRITLDPARVFEGNSAQKVDSGTAPLGLHVENGTTPFAPDLLWFYCVKAASSGSETTVCDGNRVWEQLSTPTRELFLRQPLRYSRNVPSHLWRRLAAHLANDGRVEEQMKVTDLYELSNSGTDPRFTLNDDGSLHYECSIPAARRTRWSTKIAWATSIFGPSYNYEAPKIRFADGTEIPEDAAAECKEVTDRLTEDLSWVDGDLVLIDNTRIMHGRRAITDPERTIFNAQTFARGL